ncbi:hypothetical protein LRP49_19725 [Enterovibrio sp. ZSDZ35]|uniref:Uncharacterized protein n=1 Tax=Enterovibrio qingdaonensis TaxID=2899818 RepID=A0ABT5QSE7_9GAMM|nr:hypothetical protein [Enterovibrio sp. ZSDZ35]MDD1783405.1 hypothetical protein [Enterovibrio sp. ZSDZ35]
MISLQGYIICPVMCIYSEKGICSTAKKSINRRFFDGENPEAFANLYYDFASNIVDDISGNAPDPLSLTNPTVENGAQGMAFVYASVRSRDNEGKWEPVKKLY